MIMARHIAYLVMDIEVNPTTYYLKINYEYGVKVKKSETVNRVFGEHLFRAILSDIYDGIDIPGKGAVKITLNVSNFTSQHQKTLSLLDLDEDLNEKKLGEEIHRLREKYGLDILKSGGEL